MCGQLNWQDDFRKTSEYVLIATTAHLRWTRMLRLYADFYGEMDSLATCLYEALVGLLAASAIIVACWAGYRFLAWRHRDAIITIAFAAIVYWNVQSPAAAGIVLLSRGSLSLLTSFRLFSLRIGTCYSFLPAT